MDAFRYVINVNNIRCMLWCDYNEFYVMNRIKCIVSYDGSKFHGFQVQNQFRTVQGEIQKAIKNICKDENIVVHASGRTDAKVHGRRQVFHFDTLREMPENNGKGLLITFYLMIFILLIVS